MEKIKIVGKFDLFIIIFSVKHTYNKNLELGVQIMHDIIIKGRALGNLTSSPDCNVKET